MQLNPTTTIRILQGYIVPFPKKKNRLPGFMKTRTYKIKKNTASAISSLNRNKAALARPYGMHPKKRLPITDFDRDIVNIPNQIKVRRKKEKKRNNRPPHSVLNTFPPQSHI